MMFAPRHLPLLATFVQVCRDGSFTKAAHNLAVSKSLVSAQLRSLEAALGTRLLERTTRRLALTQTGTEILAAADRMLSAANEVERIVTEKHDLPTGVLRVAAPVDMGALLVAPAVARLCARYPQLRAEIVLDDGKTDLIAHRLDAVLSINAPKDSTLVSSRLGNDIEIIVAAPMLAAKWRNAHQPKDLADAPWIAHPAIPASARHQFRNQRGTKQRITAGEPCVIANTADAIRSLVVGGAGFAVVPSQMVVEDIRSGRMVRVLSEWRGRDVVVHICLPSRSHQPARVKAFVAELRAMFKITGFAQQYATAAPRHALRYPKS